MLTGTSWVLSGFGAVIGAITALGALQLLYFVVSGGIPGTGFYYARRLRDANPHVRQEAVKELVERADTFSLRLLLKALEDRDLTIRISAIEGLGNFRDPVIIEPLLKHLAERNLIVKIKTIEALGKVPSEMVTPALVEVLSDPDPRVKLVALRIFKESRDPLALSAIARLVLDHDEQVHNAANSVLQHYGSEAIAALSAMILGAGDGARRVVKLMSDIDRAGSYEPFKQAFFEATDPAVIKVLLEALIDNGRAGTAEFLIPFLEDASFPGREAVVENVCYLHDPICLMPLCHLLNDTDVRLRRKAATSLDILVGNCRDLDVVDPLCGALLDTDPEIRRFAARALGRIGGRVVQQKVVEAMWGSHAHDVAMFIEGIVGYPLSRMVSFDELLLALDRVLTNQRLSEEALRAVDLLESLMIVLHGANVRGQRVDDIALDLLVKGRRTFYPLRLYELHPLAAGLLEFVTNKAEGDRWRVTSYA